MHYKWIILPRDPLTLLSVCQNLVGRGLVALVLFPTRVLAMLAQPSADEGVRLQIAQTAGRS